MIDQLVIGDKASYDDYEASIAFRDISQPEKKVIKETIPFSNRVYDFSAINGELYWDERDLSYAFEIIADNPVELEEKKARFLAWVMNVINEEIYDPFIEEYHFLGTYDSAEIEDDESIEKTTITVNFKAYPYKIANTSKVYSVSIGGESSAAITIVNESSHRVQMTITTDSAITFNFKNVSYTIPAGTATDSNLMLEAGNNSAVIENGNSTAAVVSIEFREEIF